MRTSCIYRLAAPDNPALPAAKTTFDLDLSVHGASMVNTHGPGLK